MIEGRHVERFGRTGPRMSAGTLSISSITVPPPAGEVS